MKSIVYLTTIFMWIFTTSVCAQRELNLEPYLKMIQDGRIDEVRSLIPILKQNNQNSYSLLYLEALTSIDGNYAMSLYNQIANSNSAYADDAIFKLSQYYYAIGRFAESDNLVRRLKNEFPNSPYSTYFGRRDVTIKTTEQKEQKEITTKKYSESSYSEGAYTIQVGAFIEETNAERLKSIVEKYGKASINVNDVKGKRFYVVNVGSFNDKQEGEILLQRLRDEVFINGTIVKNTKRNK
ncbi:MAG: SPOR domain-containing protein [Ignavibacteria bacterium]|nr:SPOR domain-containing protein [Ignavibacteria bacterium]